MNQLWIMAAIAIIIFVVAFLLLARKEKEASQTLTPGEPFGSKDESVVFDLETTGLDPSTCEIIEIGAIRIDRRVTASKGSFELQAFNSLLKPLVPITSQITRINGISQEMVEKDGKDLAEVLPLFLDFIGDTQLVAYNASFDLGFLNAAAARHNLRIANEGICALKMVRKAWPRLESYKLKDISKALNLPNTFSLENNDHHRCLGDCQRTALLYLAASSHLGVRSLGL